MSSYASPTRSVHWNDESISEPFPGAKRRISINASLPFHSKLNIRIHAHRLAAEEINEDDQVKATATIRRLTPEEDDGHRETLQRLVQEHYLTDEGMNESYLSSSSASSSSISPERSPRHRQISLPVSLPIDQRLYLYIRNGEVLARC